MEGFQERASSATTPQIQAGRQVQSPPNPANATSTANALTATETAKAAEAVSQKRVAALSNPDQTSTVPLAKSEAETVCYKSTDEGLNAIAAKCTQLSSLNLDGGFESETVDVGETTAAAAAAITGSELALEPEPELEGVPPVITGSELALEPEP
eukprot:COSAG01_NODE_6483_length_3639_cov_27.490113_4_plen_154_part_01